jgi:hypothetical protein
MAADGFTTVHVTTDPVEGEMLVEALRAEAHPSARALLKVIADP